MCVFRVISRYWFMPFQGSPTGVQRLAKVLNGVVAAVRIRRGPLKPAVLCCTMASIKPPSICHLLTRKVLKFKAIFRSETNEHKERWTILSHRQPNVSFWDWSRKAVLSRTGDCPRCLGHPAWAPNSLRPLQGPSFPFQLSLCANPFVRMLPRLGVDFRWQVARAERRAGVSYVGRGNLLLANRREDCWREFSWSWHSPFWGSGRFVRWFLGRSFRGTLRFGLGLRR